MRNLKRPGRSVPMGFVLLAMLLLTAVSALGQSRNHKPRSKTPSPFESVNPFIGTAGDGNTFPGATMPFGMMQWSPDTTRDGWYRYPMTSILGFSLTHLSGAGCPIFGDFPVLPWLGPVAASPGAEGSVFQLPFSHQDAAGKSLELAEPGYYSVQTSAGIRVELTVTERSGIARIHFPADSTHSLLFDAGNATAVSGSRKGDVVSEITVSGASEVAGATSGGPFCEQSNNNNRYNAYFFAELKHPSQTHGVWQDGMIFAGTDHAQAHRAGAYLTLPGTRAEDVLLRIGLSFTSIEEAKANLKAEQNGWDFDATRKAARTTWENVLARIDTQGGTAEQRHIFYTGLYHMLLAPNLFSDADGHYAGFDGREHRLENDRQYTNFSDWDIYRDVIQFDALMFPKETSAMMRSLVRDAEESGSLPKWPVANDVSAVMGGDSPPILLASAYAFGARDFDAREGLRYAVHVAREPGVPEKALASSMRGVRSFEERLFLRQIQERSFIPSDLDQMSVSRQLEYANADFAISRLALAVSEPDLAREFTRSAQSWRNVYDPGIGYMRPRNADGSFLKDFDLARTSPRQLQPWYKDAQMGFEEGNTLQYTWMVPFDYAGLFSAMGGTARAIDKLDRFFSQPSRGEASPHFTIDNEPDFAALYAYLFAGQPWKTQALVPHMLAQQFNASPSGIPGNDDLGATSGVYVWGALGLYPEIPGVGGLVVGSPLFERAVLHLSPSTNITIERSGVGPYVQSLKVNGAVDTKSWIALSSLNHPQNRLEFVMGTEPEHIRGTKNDEIPPSFDAKDAEPSH